LVRNVEPLRTVTVDWHRSQFSPDGNRLALEVDDGKQSDVSIHDTKLGTLAQLTFDSVTNDIAPLWTPGGQGLLFWSRVTNQTAKGSLSWIRADGTTREAQRLTQTENTQIPGSWARIQNTWYLAIEEDNPKTHGDVVVLPMEGDEVSGWKAGKPEVFANTPAGEFTPAFSPDGHWLAMGPTRGATSRCTSNRSIDLVLDGRSQPPTRGCSRNGRPGLNCSTESVGSVATRSWASPIWTATPSRSARHNPGQIGG
jgi:Tol biopolymer transport system component